MSRFRTMKKNNWVIWWRNRERNTNICFYSPKEFDKFIKDFKEMRYPGYGWRYKDKGRNKGENNLVNHHHKTWVSKDMFLKKEMFLDYSLRGEKKWQI